MEYIWLEQWEIKILLFQNIHMTMKNGNHCIYYHSVGIKCDKESLAWIMMVIIWHQSDHVILTYLFNVNFHERENSDFKLFFFQRLSQWSNSPIGMLLLMVFPDIRLIISFKREIFPHRHFFLCKNKNKRNLCFNRLSQSPVFVNVIERNQGVKY